MVGRLAYIVCKVLKRVQIVAQILLEEDLGLNKML